MFLEWMRQPLFKLFTELQNLLNDRENRIDLDERGVAVSRLMRPLVRFVQRGGGRGQVVIERERDSPRRAKTLGDMADVFRRIRNGRLQPRELVVEVDARGKRQRVRL